MRLINCAVWLSRQTKNGNSAYCKGTFEISNEIAKSHMWRGFVFKTQNSGEQNKKRHQDVNRDYVCSSPISGPQSRIQNNRYS